MSRKLYGVCFYGNEASDYAKENGYLDYATLSKAFATILNNDIMRNTGEIGFWEQVHGSIFNDEECENMPEIFQCYIISESGAEILKTWTEEIVYYNEELNMYVWGVTHFGTSWDYVLTDIKLNCREEAFK